MIKIVIAGIGGVGGYFGGLLAKQFHKNKNIAIYFVARGGHLQQIQNRGLRVIKGNTEFIAKPFLSTDTPAEIGIADFVVICTKSHGLEEVIQTLKPCIAPDTVLLPLLNGVDSKERIKNILPNNLILEGCVYIVSRLKENGVIENSGNIQTLYFGLDGTLNKKLVQLQSLFQQAGIEATLSQNISSIIWEKFIFISPTATATSYFDNCIGELLSNKEKLKTVISLIEEVKQIARAKNIIISEDISEKTLNKLKALPFETTSSMHSDFKKKNLKNELESLTAYVVREGKKYNLKTPIYSKAYAELLKKY